MPRKVHDVNYYLWQLILGIKLFMAVCTFPDFISLSENKIKKLYFWCKQSARNPVVTPWLGIVAINSLDRDKSKFGRFIWLMRKKNLFSSVLESQWNIKLWQRHKKDWQIGNYKCTERRLLIGLQKVKKINQ